MGFMTDTPHAFLNCDWGTTRFRLRLVDIASGTILKECISDQGAGVLSRETGLARAEHFQRVLQTHVIKLFEDSPTGNSPCPILISGMASSSLGWRELPYARLPFSLAGEQLVSMRITGQDHLRPFPIILISGACNDHEVMRGEEMELIGIEALFAQQAAQVSNYWVILPGTHSKHARVQQGTLTDFATFMTGELFQLLGRQSSLRHIAGDMTLLSRPERETEGWQTAFADGVKLSTQRDLSRLLFQVRTRQLLQRENRIQSGGFLSGLLIGCELCALQLRTRENESLVLAAAPDLAEPYQRASQLLGMKDRILTVPPADVSRLSALGQARILPRVLTERS